MSYPKLTSEFYRHNDVCAIAKALLGKVLVTHFKEGRTAGIITETEAYGGVTDKAAHSYGGRRTARTEVMFSEGGLAYVYLCYGIHHLFNVVTGAANTPTAILVRAIEPIEGVEVMRERRKHPPDKRLAAGPGTLSQALGITTGHNATDLLGKIIWIEDRNIIIPTDAVRTTPRIGIDYAGDDAARPWRFVANR